MATTATLPPPRTRGARFPPPPQPYPYLLPAFAVMALIVFYPLAYQVWMSFHEFGLKNFRTVNPVPAEFIGLDNYIRVATSQLQIPNFEFVRLVLFNLVWAFSNVVVHVILGVFIAIVLNTQGLKLQRFWRSLYIIPVVIPSIIVAAVWRNMFDPDSGAINLGLQALGGIVGIPPDHPAFHLNWIRQA